MSWSRAVIDLLTEQLPRAAEGIVGAVAEEIPAYAEGDFPAGVEQALVRFVTVLEDPHAVEDPAWRAAISDLGRSAAGAGRSLEALLAAYRVGARHAWREISSQGTAAGIQPDELFRLAEELFLYIDELSAISAEGYAAEQIDRAGERQRHRRALAELLLTGADAASIAEA